MNHFPWLVGEARELEQVGLEAGLRLERLARVVGEPPGLRHFAGTGVLASSRAADDEDASWRSLVLMTFSSFMDGIACREPFHRQQKRRIGEFCAGGTGPRRLAVLDVAVPGALEDLLEFRLHVVERGIAEARIEAAAELLARKRDVLAELPRLHAGSCL
jgi:hypothetical protein